MLTTFPSSAAFVKFAAAAVCPVALPESSIALTHVDLQQFARIHSSESLLSPQRPLQIVEAFTSYEAVTAARSERASTPCADAAAPGWHDER